VHASEDTFNANSIKLWAAANSVDARLLERPTARRLRKPMELCIYCKDPVGESETLDAVESVVASDEALRRLISPNMDAVVTSIRDAVPNPAELLPIFVLRYGEREIHRHAVIVTMIAVAIAAACGYSRTALPQLEHAGMLHDVGELYLDPTPFVLAMTSLLLRRTPCRRIDGPLRPRS